MILPLDISIPSSALRRRDALVLSQETELILRQLYNKYQPQRDIQVLVDTSEPQNTTISLHVPDSQEGCCLLVSKNITTSEWALIDSHSTSIIPKTGRFLTMHKRRRKRLTTRSLSQDPALLDDIHHGQVECVLERVWKWPFNAFTLDTATGGRSLPVLCVHLFHWYGLTEHFNLDVVRIWKLFSLIEEGYHGTNPYHNSIHATDVTQAMHCFLQEEKIKRHLTPLEIMASLLAAVAHDLDHPGVNQPFLIATSNHLAALYENTSVLENHHWRSAVGCLLESNVAEQLGSVRPELERQISSLILATDITRQQEFLTRFQTYLDTGTLDLSRAEDRHFILQIALKCADISNPCRPWDVSKKWSQKVCEEFFRQGDYERQLNLPVTSLCDRHTTSIPKIQTGFFKFVVLPLFEEWHRFQRSRLSTNMMTHLHGNHHRWTTLLAAELAEETKTEISDAEECGEVEEEEGEGGEVDSRRCSLPAVMLETVDRLGRRHSVPINFAGNEINVPGGRRESLPVGERVRRFIGVHEKHLEEEEEEEDDEEFNMSLRSSCSSGIQRSSEYGSADERPVSAENLLPEPSIASITTHDEASRLSSVLHGSSCLTLPANRMLTRQQTFPPLQPYVRQRYMSTTGQELGNTGALSGGSSTSSDVSSSESNSPLPPPSGGGSNSSVHPVSSGGSNASVAQPSVSGGSNSSTSPVVAPSGGNARIKRDSSEASSTGFPSKVARMWREKENVAPSTPRPPELLVSGESPLVKRNSLTIPQVSTRRRGSAPVGSDSVLKSLMDKQSRRGSVPSEVSKPPPSSQQCSVLNPLDSNGSSGLPRRSSLPYDLVKHSLSPTSIGYSGERRSSDGVVTRGVSKRRLNKLLKRRSSGGPDLILCPPSPSQTITPRRGSLPLDVISSSLSSGTT